MSKFEDMEPIKRAEIFDQLLFGLEKDVEDILPLVKKLKKAQKRADKIGEYLYSPQWLEDFEQFKDHPGLHILGEDYAYNALDDLRQIHIQLLKIISKSL